MCHHLEQADVVAVEFDGWRGFEGAVATVFFSGDEKKSRRESDRERRRCAHIYAFTHKDDQFVNC